LANPVHDAEAMADAFRGVGFDVQLLLDPDYARLVRALREFGVRAQNSDAAVVFYAGHGLQVDHENYLLPVDATLERERDLVYEALPLTQFLMEASQARKISIIILDACRDNPFAERLARSAPPGRQSQSRSGLARVED